MLSLNFFEMELNEQAKLPPPVAYLSFRKVWQDKNGKPEKPRGSLVLTPVRRE